RDFFRKRDADTQGLRHQNGYARLELRRLDGDGEAPPEARLQALFEPLYFFRIAVAAEDDVVLAFQQRVERVEELFLRTILVGKELNVVDQERIERAIRRFELVDV